MSYDLNLKKNFPSYLTSRILPFLGISIAFALVAHKNAEDLSVFSYILAIFSVVSIAFSMPLAAIGNLKVCSESIDIRDSFRKLFTISLFFSVVAFFISLIVVFFLSDTFVAKKFNRETFLNASYIYIISIPLLVINTFLHIFLESNGHSLLCSRVKVFSGVALFGFLVFCFFFVDKVYFIYCATAYFLGIEFFAFVLYLKLSKSKGFVFSLMYPGIFFKDLMLLGLPISAGMIGQKIYFYLLNNRLLIADVELVSALAVCVSVAGFMTVPMLSFAQVHSVYSSKNLSDSRYCYRRGLGWLSVMLFILLVLFFVFRAGFFYLFGGDSFESSYRAFWGVSALLCSASVFAFVMAHLRSLKDTLLPQILINVIMLLVLIPAIYSSFFDFYDVYSFIFAQSSMVSLAVIVLQFRIRSLHGRLVVGNKLPIGGSNLL